MHPNFRGEDFSLKFCRWSSDRFPWIERLYWAILCLCHVGGFWKFEYSWNQLRLHECAHQICQEAQEVGEWNHQDLKICRNPRVLNGYSLHGSVPQTPVVLFVRWLNRDISRFLFVINQTQVLRREFPGVCQTTKPSPVHFQSPFPSQVKSRLRKCYFEGFGHGP